MARYRILSLDGGGMRGIFSATILARIEEMLGEPLHKHFDMAAGTSTGGILACGVGAEIPGDELIALYEKHGETIFPPDRWKSRLIRILSQGPSMPKYDGKGLEKALKKVFGNTKFGSLKVTPTLAITYDLMGREPVIFKSNREEYADVPVWEICKATASAPTYFPAHVMKVRKAERPLVDGGVVANNPVLCAIGEAVALKQKIEDLVVLSIGTGDTKHPISIEESQEWGLLEWGFHIVGVLFEGPNDANHYIASNLVQGNGYLRLQTELTGLDSDMDNADKRQLNGLKALAEDYVNSRPTMHAIERFLTLL